MKKPTFVIALLALLAASHLAAAPEPGAAAARKLADLAPVPAVPASGSARVGAIAAAASNTDRRVEEDDQVRIEETRARGESQRIVVKPKTAGAKEYEIVPATGAVDPSQRHRRGTGERVWRVLSF